MTGTLRLLQLCSPALPIGGFAYSQGLEGAVAQGWVKDEDSAGGWILGLLAEALGNLEVPVLWRLLARWDRRWNDFLFASRGSAELRAEEQRLGSALARLLAGLGLEAAGPWVADPGVTHAGMFALAAGAWEIPAREAVAGFLFGWTENQVGAATRLIALGQSGAQRILSRAVAIIPGVVERGVGLGDEEIGAAAPGQAIASALHEAQYSRIFRS